MPPDPPSCCMLIMFMGVTGDPHTSLASQPYFSFNVLRLVWGGASIGSCALACYMGFGAGLDAICYTFIVLPYPHIWVTGGRKTDRVVAVALSCLAHPIHILAASPAPGHAVVPTYGEKNPNTTDCRK